jgi:hypothetical protein
MGADATFCKGGGVSDVKKGDYLSCSHSPFAFSCLLLLLRRFLGGAEVSVASGARGVSWVVRGVSSCTKGPTLGASVVAIVSMVLRQTLRTATRGGVKNANAE